MLSVGYPGLTPNGSGGTIPALRLLFGLAELWPLYGDEAKALISHAVKKKTLQELLLCSWAFSRTSMLESPLDCPRNRYSLESDCCMWSMVR